MPHQYTRLTPNEWSCLLNLYSISINTIPELAERHEVSTSSITGKARAAGTTRLAKFSATAGIVTALGATAALPISIAATSGNKSQ